MRINNETSKALAQMVQVIREEKEQSYQEGLAQGISIVEKIISWLRPSNKNNQYAQKVAGWAEKELEKLQESEAA